MHVEQVQRSLSATALASGENWISRDGVFRVRPGVTKFGAAAADARPMGLIQFRTTAGVTHVVLATKTGWKLFNPTTLAWDDKSGTALTANNSDQQVFRVFESGGKTYLLGTNGADTPKKWEDTLSAYAAVGGSPPKARCMAIANSHVLLCNLKSGSDASPLAVDVSAFNDFGSGWNGATQTEALKDTPGAIVSALEMGNLQSVIYKDDSIYMAVAQGASDPFRFDLKWANVSGPCATLAVGALSNGTHVYLGIDGNLYTFDGVIPNPVGPNIQRYIMNTRDPSNANLSFLTVDTERDEVWIHYPEIGSDEPALAAVVNMSNGALWPMRWTNRKFSASAKLAVPTAPSIDSLTGAIDGMTRAIDTLGTETRLMLLGDTGGQIYQLAGHDDDGDEIEASFETGLSDLGANFASLQEIDYQFARAERPQEVAVRIGAANYGEDRVLGAEQTFDIGEPGPYHTGHRVSARGISLAMTVSATERVEFLGARAGVVVRGAR